MLVNEEEDGSFRSIEKQYNEVVASYCRDLGVTIVDPLPAFEASAGAASQYSGRQTIITGPAKLTR